MSMDSGDLVVAHCIGDYALQNDWMAQNKTKNSLACAIHAGVYTGVFAAMSWMKGKPLKPRTLAVIGLTHYAIDRNRLAAKAMDRVGQRGFKEYMDPWATIIVDNTYHLTINWIANELDDL